MIGSLVHYRALFGHAPTSDREIEGAVEALLQGVAADSRACSSTAAGRAATPKLHHLHA